ncbi:MAG: hypothetical protein ABR549_05945 [Mycobacteriales bacterium]
MTSEAPARQHAPRPPLLGQGLAGGLLAGTLLALAWVHEDALLGGIVVVQVLCVLGFLAVTEAPAAKGVFGLAVAAAAAADVIVVADEGRVRYLGAVVGLALVAGLLHQLVRRERSRVTESLADTLVVVTLVTAAAGLAAAGRTPAGIWPTRVALAAAAAALLTGRIGDRVVHRPALAVGSTRAWPGLLLALGSGVAAATVTGHDHLDKAPLIGLAAAAAIAATDLLIDLAAAELTPAQKDARRVAALRPTSLVVPLALLGPVVLAAVRLLDR